MRAHIVKMIVNGAKNIIPKPLRRLYSSWCHYEEYDTSEFWKRKASKGGWQAIYWHNELYDLLFDAEQKEYLKAFLTKHAINPTDPILDIGCGIGRLSKFFSDIGYTKITAVDFPEMIEQARTDNDSESIRYIECAAQDFLVDLNFRLIISSSCFGVIRRREFLFKAIENCTKMQRSGDYLLMIDPFHKNKFLSQARARISGKEIINLMNEKGYDLVEKSGMLFFPVKLLITNRWNMSEVLTRKLFYVGEAIAKVLSQYYWSDYKTLGFLKR